VQSDGASVFIYVFLKKHEDYVTPICCSLSEYFGEACLSLFDLLLYSFDNSAKKKKKNCSFDIFFSNFTDSIFDITVPVLQAEKPSWNSIGIFKVSNITGKRRDLVPSKPATDDTDMESEGSDSDEDSEDEEELGGSGAPNLQATSSFFLHFVNFMTGLYLRCLFFP
jgi:hypothetical protein